MGASWGLRKRKKSVFHRSLDFLFVAPFPNAVIKNNNADNGVPSTKQWQERPTSVWLRNGIHAPAVWPSSGYSTRRFLTRFGRQQIPFCNTTRRVRDTLERGSVAVRPPQDGNQSICRRKSPQRFVLIHFSTFKVPYCAKYIISMNIPHLHPVCVLPWNEKRAPWNTKPCIACWTSASLWIFSLAVREQHTCVNQKEPNSSVWVQP